MSLAETCAELIYALNLKTGPIGFMGAQADLESTLSQVYPAAFGK